MTEPIIFAGYMVVLVAAAFVLGRFQGFARGSTWAKDGDAILSAAQAKEEAMAAAGDNGLGKTIAGAIDVPPRPNTSEKFTPRKPDPFPETIHIFKAPFIGGTFTVRLLEAMDAALENRFGDPLAARYVVNGVRLSAWSRDALVQFRQFLIENTLGFKGGREPETRGPLWAVKGLATWDSERRGWFIAKDHTTHVAIPAETLRPGLAGGVPLFEMPGTIHGGHDGSLIDDDEPEELRVTRKSIDDLGLGEL